MPVTAIDHVALPTADAERFLRFYKALGFGIEHEDEWRRGRFPIFSIVFGDNKINVHPETLVEKARGHPAFLRGPTAEPGCGDLCFVWDGGIEDLLGLLDRAGARPIAGPVLRVGGRANGSALGISVYVRDPDENLLEFISYRPDDVARWRDAPGAVSSPAQPEGNRAAVASTRGRLDVRRLTHLGICVSDLERSVRFYCDVLGCEEVGRLDLEGEPTARLNGMPEAKVRLAFLERDGWRLELFAYSVPAWIGPQSPRPMNQLGPTHLSFRVADLDAACAEIEAAGGGLLPETRLDLPGPVRVVMAFDPDGVRLELIEKAGDPGALPLDAGAHRSRPG